MDNYFILNLIFIILIDINRIESRLPFHCNAKEAELIKNPKSIFRFILKEDTIYLILKYKIIEFKVPNFIENNEFSYTIKQPYFIENIEKEKESKDLIGYLISTDDNNLKIEQMRQSIVEHYEDGTKVGKKIHLFQFKLKFDNIPGEIVNMKQQILEDKIINSKYRFNFNVDYFPNIIFDYFNESKLKISLKQQNLTQFKNLKLNYLTRYLLFHAFNKSSNHLIELDNKNVLHFNRLNFEVSNNSLSIINITNQLNIPLSRFLNCHQSFNDFKQLTGIYFDKQMNSFYLFLERYYLLIKYDLIKYKFKLKQTKLIFFENAFYLNFSKNDFKDLIFEYSNSSKWIKIIGNQFYLTTYNQLFSLKISKDQSITVDKVKMENDNKFILECKGQILNLKLNRYCFTDKSYYFIDKLNKIRLFKVKDLFNSTPITFENYQSIEFIFDYKDNTFVLMTKSHIFIIEYTIIKIDSNNQLIFNYDKSKIFRKIQNCLLNDDCKINDSELDKKSLIKSKKIIIYIISIILIIIIFTLYKRFKNRDSINISTISTIKKSEFNSVKQPETLYINKIKNQSESTSLSPSSVQLFKHFGTKRKSTKPINKSKKNVYLIKQR